MYISNRKIFLLIFLVMFQLLTVIKKADAITILETAPLGVINGGTSILPTTHPSTQFLGVRFSLNSSYLITKVGGHVKGNANDDRSMFVSINPIGTPSSFPNDVFLSDAIFSESFIAPFNDIGPFPYQVPETILDTNFILGPGSYSFMFGSGLFGATGLGWMPIASRGFKK